MSTKEIIELYYKHANAGEWMKWCDLFDENQIMDEQLAGHIEKLSILREMMAGMGANYAIFKNEPRHILVDENRAAVVSHISARATNFPEIPIEAEVMNYFEIENGKIIYMSNYHDSKPFKPFLDQFE